MRYVAAFARAEAAPTGELVYRMVGLGLDGHGGAPELHPPPSAHPIIGAFVNAPQDRKESDAGPPRKEELIS